MQEAGATADIELAYTLADGLEYLRAVLLQEWILMHLLHVYLSLELVFEPFYGNC